MNLEDNLMPDYDTIECLQKDVARYEFRYNVFGQPWFQRKWIGKKAWDSLLPLELMECA